VVYVLSYINSQLLETTEDINQTKTLKFWTQIAQYNHSDTDESVCWWISVDSANSCKDSSNLGRYDVIADILGVKVLYTLLVKANGKKIMGEWYYG